MVSKRGSIVRNGNRHAKRNGKKCSIKGLEKLTRPEVLKILPKRDKDGKRYYPICDYRPHRGHAVRPKVCEEKGCIYYHKLYLTKLTQVYKTKN